MNTNNEIQLMILTNLVRYSCPQQQQLIQLVQQLPLFPENLVIEELRHMDQNHLNYLNLIVSNTIDLKASFIPTSNSPWLTSGGQNQLEQLQSETNKYSTIQNTFNLNSQNLSNGPQTLNLGSQVTNNSAHYYHEQNTNSAVYQQFKTEIKINTPTNSQQWRPVQALLHFKFNLVPTLTKIWHLIKSIILLLAKLVSHPFIH